MIYNYIVKSLLETTEVKNKVFSVVEKDVATNPLDALELYNKHIEKNLNPIILKRDKNNWKEITVLELEKDIQGTKKLPGLKKAFKIKSGGK